MQCYSFQTIIFSNKIIKELQARFQCSVAKKKTTNFSDQSEQTKRALTANQNSRPSHPLATGKSAGKQIADGRNDFLRVQAVKKTPLQLKSYSIQIAPLLFQSLHQNSSCQSNYFPNTSLNIFHEYTDRSIVKRTELAKVALRW